MVFVRCGAFIDFFTAERAEIRLTIVPEVSRYLIMQRIYI